MLQQLGGLLKTTEIVGIDIGTHSIKIVEIDHQKKGQKLTTFAITHHTTALDGYWDGSTLRTMARVIEKLMQKSKFAAVKTVLSVRSKDVYVTSMDFKGESSEAEIRNEINEQAPYFLPLPPNEMRLSYDMLKSPTTGGKKRVIINATPDYIIENTRNLLEHLNLDGEAIENATLSQIRSCLAINPKTVILVDLGAEHTVLSLVSANNLRSSTYIPTGTQKIAKDMSESLGTNIDIAELFMKDLNLVDLAHLPKQYLDFLFVLKDELTTFDSMNKEIGQGAEEVVITGGGANTPGIKEFFQDFHLPVSIAQPLTGLLLDEDILPYISPLQNQLSVAIGLAKRSDIL